MKHRSSIVLASALAISAFVQNLAATGGEDPPFSVPENGSSVLLIVLALAGVALLKRAFNRR
jgi:hypothetical protein